MDRYRGFPLGRRTVDYIHWFKIKTRKPAKLIVGRGFKPGRGDGILTAIKIRSIPSFGWEVKLEVPCRKILRHVKNPLTHLQELLCEILTPSIPLTGSQMSLLVGLPQGSGGRVRSFTQLASSLSSSPCLSTFSYHPGDEQ
jgi:hypothetical protein